MRSSRLGWCSALMFIQLGASSQAYAASDPLVRDRSVAEHYTWGGDNDGWYLVKRDDTQVIEERIVPGGRETLHLHHRSRQVFFVLSGILTMRLEGVVHKVGPNQLIEVPPGAAHQTLNETDAPVDMIVYSTPPSHGDKVDLLDSLRP